MQSESLTNAFKICPVELFSKYICHGDGSLQKYRKQWNAILGNSIVRIFQR
jgi:hypothetical protein